jgi:hypothetical protein
VTPPIKAPLLVQYAENDERINVMWPDYEKALKSAGVPHEVHMLPDIVATVSGRSTWLPLPLPPCSSICRNDR